MASSNSSQNLLAAEIGLAKLTATTLIVWGTGDFHGYPLRHWRALPAGLSD